jgi:hypothetical protein
MMDSDSSTDRPMRGRPAFCLPVAAGTFFLIALLSMLLSPAAGADINGTSYGSTSDMRTGAHGNLTAGANFTYSSPDEDLKRLLVDTPAGGVGNPNAIPYADRCPKAVFETGVCPPSSQIGTTTLDVKVMPLIPPEIPQTLTGTVSIIQTDPEVPTLVGAYFPPATPIDSATRAYARFYPVTSGPDGDFRIRMVTDDFPRTATVGGVPTAIRVDRWEEFLWGVLPSGVPFLTNPTRCETWMSYGYAQAYDSNTNVDSDPLMTGSNEFVKAEVPSTPDCTTTPPFPIKASAAIGSGARGDSPSLTTTLEMPGVGLGDQAPDAAKSVVATLPKAINADILQLGRLCPLANIDNDTCPENSKVGSLTVETPMIAAGLTGDAYLTAPSGASSLPDLVLKVRGAINFTVRGINRYVNTSQLQSTFDNLAQPGFSRVVLTIFGGKDGLLKNIACPKTQNLPPDGPMHFDITGYTGQRVGIDAPLSWAGCYGITTIRSTKCAKRTLNVKAYYRSRPNIRKVRLYVNGRLAQTRVKAPFKFKKSVRRYHKGRKKLTLRAFYKDGTVVKKSARFKRC